MRWRFYLEEVKYSYCGIFLGFIYGCYFDVLYGLGYGSFLCFVFLFNCFSENERFRCNFGRIFFFEGSFGDGL